MLSSVERERMLALMGVPTYVLRTEDAAPAPKASTEGIDRPIGSTAPASNAGLPTTSSGSNPPRPPQHASLDALSASIRASAEAMGKTVRPVVKRGPMPILVGQLPDWPNLQRDLAWVFGQTEPVSPPAQWPAYAVVLGKDLQVPASVISVRVSLPLRSASAKRALWRQLRPLLATARPV
ncbi:hypothetical protein C7S18_03125 [Ahniella affigens]|uniref:Uncharacterized protein n=1 Tax=Ahniella affigens TaxID=2021234 RepID=A0A2P1PN19_9GAMM|nr:hypothetical protein [Ahniella affigens]AVP96243.1 hypothetical protein C7S18_03125 [Ahniella affigens]